MYDNEAEQQAQTEPWQTAPAPEDAEDAKELAAMNEAELDAEMQEEMGTFGRWMLDNAGAAEFANSLYPDLMDIDDAHLAVQDAGAAAAGASDEIDTVGGA